MLIYLSEMNRELQMRECWNWQTGTFEGRVSHGVWVQVPSLAPKKVSFNK